MEVTSQSRPRTPMPSSSNRYPNLDSAVKPARVFRKHKSGNVDCKKVLTTTFGKLDYKGKQKEIVEAAMYGCDIFVGAPTGMGKSLCFQLPAVADLHAGLTVVVSPLLALMKDQVAKLRELDIYCAALTSETGTHEKTMIIDDLESGLPVYRLIYLTPEKLVTKEFMNILKVIDENRQLNRLVVDEAHCISEWGHDFREEYRKLGRFRDHFPDVPITALTASATPAVQEDIISSLKMSSDHLFSVVHPFNRENLFYEIRHLPCVDHAKQFDLIYSYIRSLTERRGKPSTGVIYARTRATCDDLAQYLRGKGMAARPYHRGIARGRLDRTLEEWAEGDGTCDVVCCTVAFGLGIDKGDVRYVIHYDLPKSFEGYYQETGRAGRDGEPAKCVLYYSREDAVKARHLVKRSMSSRMSRSSGPEPSQRAPDSIEALIAFAENIEVCRHVLVCRYFGEVIDEKDEALVRAYCNKMCDVCKNPEKTKRRKEELASEAWISTQLPRLRTEAAALSDDEDYSLSVGRQRLMGPAPRHSAVTTPRTKYQTHMQGLAAGSSHTVETSGSTSTTPQPTKPISRPSSSKTTTRLNVKFGVSKKTDEYDGPVLQRGHIKLRVPSSDDDGYADEGVARISRRHGNNGDDDDSGNDEGTSAGAKRRLPLQLHQQPQNNVSPPAKRPKVFGDGSKGFGVAPGRKISSAIPFKVPWKTGVQPPLIPPPPVAPSLRRSSISSRHRLEAPDETGNNDASAELAVELPKVAVEEGETFKAIIDIESDDDDDLNDEIEELVSLSDAVRAELEQYSELDAEFSQKVPIPDREEGLKRLQQTLQRALLENPRASDVWQIFVPEGKNVEKLGILEQTRIVGGCAIRLEFNAMSYAISGPGYILNVDARVQAIRSLRKLATSKRKSSESEEVERYLKTACLRVLS